MNNNSHISLAAFATGAALSFLGLTALGVIKATPANALEIPFDWSCNAAGTSCHAPGINPPAKAFPAKFFAKFGYPKEIIVKDPDAYRMVSKGWTKGGDCKARLADRTYPDVALAKAQFCKFWQVGYAAPKPKITKGW